VEAAGIDTALFDDEIVGLNWTYSNAVGGIKLIVRDDDLEDAADVLDFPSADPETLTEGGAEVVLSAAEETAEQAEAVLCPSCGSAEVTRVPRMRFFLFLAVIGGGAGLALHQYGLGLMAVLVAALVTAIAPSHRCTACGERWSARPPAEPVMVVGPPPDVSDTLEEPCPRCGSTEFHKEDYRLFQALTLIVGFFAAPLLLPLMLGMVVAWPFLPKRHCDSCGLSV
jgi:predicted RNA-binding Zn-ribbon protein involved in translation (DUF1610 family)